MANSWFTPAKFRLASGLLNLDTADLRAILVMTNTTADTEQDVATIAGFTTLDEYNGANYARKDLGDPTVAQDDPNNRAEVTVAAFVWTALGVGSRQCQGLIIYEHVTNDSDSRPIAWIDQPSGAGGFPFDGNGGNVTMTPNVEGLLQVT